jgi:hypothetical protein
VTVDEVEALDNEASFGSIVGPPNDRVVLWTRAAGRYSFAHPDRAEPNTSESYGLRVTILMAVRILFR